MNPNTHRQLFARTVLAVALPLLALPQAARADGDILDRRVDVALADSAPDQAFQGLARMIGFDAAVEPGLDGKVTVRLQNVRMRTVLDAVCESIGCEWSVEGGKPGKLRVVPSPDRAARKTLPLQSPIDLKVTKADVRQVLQTFGQILSVDADVDPRITGTVTFELDNTPAGEALDKVCAMAGCDWKIDGSGSRQVLRVTKK